LDDGRLDLNVNLSLASYTEVMLRHAIDVVPMVARQKVCTEMLPHNRTVPARPTRPVAPADTFPLINPLCRCFSINWACHNPHTTAVAPTRPLRITCTDASSQ